MKIQLPTKIELTKDESDLLQNVRVKNTLPGLSDEESALSRKSAKALFISLANRKAIPKARWQYFSDPKFMIGSKKSWKQLLELNSAETGLALFEVPHFAKYLYYFINGPDLPPDVIFQFWSRVVSEDYVSGSDLPELESIARGAVRSNRMNPHDACEEFFKLAVECGLNHWLARDIRDAVRTIR
jgi:hypothetical protein